MVVVGCLLILAGAVIVWQREWFARTSIDWRVQDIRASAFSDPERTEEMVESLRAPGSQRLQVLITLVVGVIVFLFGVVFAIAGIG
ncbi:MAG TPA: hypothetical protein VF066_04000 [Thermoleophilaceae bacterium]